MSVRRTANSDAAMEVERLRMELDSLKNSAKAGNADGYSMSGADQFDQLTPVEQSAASLGVSPDSWKPISFLNNAHYDQLVQANMLDDSLARRIEAYRTVAAGN